METKAIKPPSKRSASVSHPLIFYISNSHIYREEWKDMKKPWKNIEITK